MKYTPWSKLVAVKVLWMGNMLKPALARGELRCIGATTLEEYRIIRKRHCIRAAFPTCNCKPTRAGRLMITILRGLKRKIRNSPRHSCPKDNALIAAATLSDRYITDRFYLIKLSI